MHLFRTIQDRPLAVLGFACVAFVGWIATSVLQPPEQADPVWEAPPQMVSVHALPLPVEAFAPAESEGVAPGLTGQADDAVVQALALATSEAGAASPWAILSLKLGMSRVAVEEVLGPPDASRIRPIAQTGDRLTYEVTYAVGPDGGTDEPPPVQRVARVSATLVALEYDATQPGHPLVRVTASALK